MTSLELERAVESLTATCHECASLHMHIGRVHADLNQAARKASRWPTTKNIAAAMVAKSELSDIRSRASLHIANHH